MAHEFILADSNHHIATLTLNRPDKHNAMHAPMIHELLKALATFAADNSRILLIQAQGENFCAGGDIAWMQKIAKSSETENIEDAQLLADLLYQLYTYPKPTIVLTQGRTLGGGLGIVSAADIVIAADNAQFALPEVKIGLTPSMISPYVIAAIGQRAAHYYFLTGEIFKADVAFRLGLVHQIAAPTALMSVGLTLADSLLKNSPQALLAAKQLIRFVTGEKITPQLAEKTAVHLANLRATPEAQEGLWAFLKKRAPKWQEK